MNAEEHQPLTGKENDMTQTQQTQAIDPQDLADVAEFFQTDIQTYADMHGYNMDGIFTADPAKTDQGH